MAMYGVFTFDEARRNGKVQAAVGRLPADEVAERPRHDHALGHGGVGIWWPSSLALPMGALIGLMAHFLVFRPLRNAAPLGKVIGSVGVLLYLQGVAQLNFGGTGRQPESDHPRRAAAELPRPRIGRARATRCGRPASPC